MSWKRLPRRDETLWPQLLKFTSVGVVSTGLHVVSALVFNQALMVSPLWANFYAFLVATVWSFLGNWAWTFNRQDAVHSSAPRFFAMTGTVFCFNQAIVYVVTQRLGLPLAAAMVPVSALVPLFSFWLMRSHIFTGHKTT